MERIDSFDNQMIADAHAGAQMAQNTLEFVRVQMTKKYKLEQGDTIERDGTIVRAKAPEGGGNG